MRISQLQHTDSSGEVLIDTHQELTMPNGEEKTLLQVRYHREEIYIGDSIYTYNNSGQRMQILDVLLWWHFFRRPYMYKPTIQDYDNKKNER